MSEMNPQIDKEIKNVKVDILNLESVEQSGLVLMDPKEATIDVKVTGRRNDLVNITNTDIIAQVDVRGYSEGVNKVPVEVKGPDELEIIDFTPKQILFKFDQIIQKQLPVTIKTIGKVADSYSLGKFQLSPSSVIVKGPRSWVNSVNTVTITVDVNELSSDLNTSLPLKPINDKGEEVGTVEVNPNVVNVNVPILPVKIVSVEPQLKGEPLKDFKITSVIVNPTVVKIKGRKEVLDKIESIKTQPVDISYTISNIKREIPLQIPQGVEVIGDAQNPVVRVGIEEILDKEIKINVEDISLRNKQDNLGVEIIEPLQEISVNVKGIESKIQNLSSEDISLYLDLEGLTKGEYEVSIKNESIYGIDDININPKKLKIVLKNVTDEEENQTENDS
ncbi:putative secreted protein [Caldisalinibacter kiritimatiensis]|uniref:Putative secreted protein n=2 Tax=Caldisalinibacter kiritimatiensis TaxID=1304284 RepID=R1CSG1_9FIRM|nr:putative secreted protein [Caldisalinibacter kiritimatiensis]